MPQTTNSVQIVLSESNFACIDGATAKGSPVRNAVDTASQQGRSGARGAGGTVMITCSEAQAQELMRLAQVSCRGAMQSIKTALADAQGARQKP